MIRFPVDYDRHSDMYGAACAAAVWFVLILLCLLIPSAEYLSRKAYTDVMIFLEPPEGVRHEYEPPFSAEAEAAAGIASAAPDAVSSGKNQDAPARTLWERLFGAERSVRKSTAAAERGASAGAEDQEGKGAPLAAGRAAQREDVPAAVSPSAKQSRTAAAKQTASAGAEDQEGSAAPLAAGRAAQREDVPATVSSSAKQSGTAAAKQTASAGAEDQEGSAASLAAERAAPLTPAAQRSSFELVDKTVRRMAEPASAELHISSGSRRYLSAPASVTITFTVLASGAVSPGTVAITPSSLLHPVIQEELKAQIRKWKFEPADKSGLVRFEYTAEPG